MKKFIGPLVIILLSAAVTVVLSRYVLPLAGIHLFDTRVQSEIRALRKKIESLDSKMKPKKGNLSDDSFEKRKLEIQEREKYRQLKERLNFLQKYRNKTAMVDGWWLARDTARYVQLTEGCLSGKREDFIKKVFKEIDGHIVRIVGYNYFNNNANEPYAKIFPFSYDIEHHTGKGWLWRCYDGNLSKSNWKCYEPRILFDCPGTVEKLQFEPVFWLGEKDALKPVDFKKLADKQYQYTRGNLKKGIIAVEGVISGTVSLYLNNDTKREYTAFTLKDWLIVKVY